jgi:hypothetical protein
MSEVKVTIEARRLAAMSAFGHHDPGTLINKWVVNGSGDEPGVKPIVFEREDAAAALIQQAINHSRAAGRAEGVASERKRACSYGAAVLPKQAQWFVRDIERGEHDKVTIESGEHEGAGE